MKEIKIGKILETRPASEGDIDFMYVTFEGAVQTTVEPKLKNSN